MVKTTDFDSVNVGSSPTAPSIYEEAAKKAGKYYTDLIIKYMYDYADTKEIAQPIVEHLRLQSETYMLKLLFDRDAYVYIDYDDVLKNYFVHAALKLAQTGDIDTTYTYVPATWVDHLLETIADRIKKSRFSKIEVILRFACLLQDEVRCRRIATQHIKKLILPPFPMEPGKNVTYMAFMSQFLPQYNSE